MYIEGILLLSFAQNPAPSPTYSLEHLRDAVRQLKSSRASFNNLVMSQSSKGLFLFSTSDDSGRGTSSIDWVAKLNPDEKPGNIVAYLEGDFKSGSLSDWGTVDHSLRLWLKGDLPKYLEMSVSHSTESKTIYVVINVHRNEIMRPIFIRYNQDLSVKHARVRSRTLKPTLSFIAVNNYLANLK